MTIHDDHMYHGAALIQIAEHPQFTAINSLKLGGVTKPSGRLEKNFSGKYLCVYCAYLCR